MRKLGIVVAAAASGLAMQANADVVVYNISGTIGGTQVLNTDNAPASVSSNYFNAQDGNNLTSCPDTSLYSCVNTGATGDALGVGPTSGLEGGITGTIAPAFTGTLTIDTDTNQVVMNINFTGTVNYRFPDVFPPAPFNGAATGDLTGWNMTVTWTTGTIGLTGGAVTAGNGVSNASSQTCDWNDADSTSNSLFCGSKQANAIERSWRTTRNDVSGQTIPDCTNDGTLQPCAALVATGIAGDTEIDYSVTGSSISGSGSYLEAGWQSTGSQPRDFAYRLCTQQNVSLSQFACGGRWVGALADQSNGTGNTSYGDSVTGGLISFTGSLAVIPVPAAVWLFGSALGLLGWIRRRASV